MHRYTLQELSALPTLIQDDTTDQLLKVSTADFRVWFSPTQQTVQTQRPTLILHPTGTSPEVVWATAGCYQPV